MKGEKEIMSYYPYMPTMARGECWRVTDKSYVRLFNASPNSPDIDVYVNGKLMLQNFAYKNFSKYVAVPPDEYTIKIYPTGQTTNPILDTKLYIPQNTAFNVAIIGKYPDINLYPVPEPYTGQNFGRPCIRFINLAPDGPTVDVTLANGTKVFNNIGYKDIADYACIPSGTYTFQVRPAGGNDIILTIPDIQLSSNNYYTIYLTGLAEGSPALEAKTVLEPRQ